MVSFAADKEPNGWPQADTLEGGTPGWARWGLSMGKVGFEGEAAEKPL